MLLKLTSEIVPCYVTLLKCLIKLLKKDTVIEIVIVIFDHVWGAFHGHCVPWCWEGSFPGLTKIPLTGHLMCCH